MRYFMLLSYRGTNYHGWQRQSNAPSVQGELERVLSARLRSDVEVTGAGRTDTGVHASYYVAHFDTDMVIDDCDGLCYHLNSMLPRDIAVRGIYPVANGAHARFDATEREYTYRIVSRKEPFCVETAWQYYVRLDIEAMNRAAVHLLEFDDFTSFAKLNSNNKTNICHVSHAEWRSDGAWSVFTIRADRFLRNMVRAITGTLVEVGRGKLSPDDFRDIIAARDLSLACSSAPAQGLFLSGIKYPENIFNPNGNECPLW